MEHDRDAERSASHAPTGELAELLACERELAELLDQSREEAGRRLKRARAAAASAAAEAEAALEQEAERERARIRDDTRARVRAIRAEAREGVARFDDVPHESVERLADVAFRHLLSVVEGA